MVGIISQNDVLLRRVFLGKMRRVASACNMGNGNVNEDISDDSGNGSDLTYVAPSAGETLDSSLHKNVLQTHTIDSLFTLLK